MVKAIRYLNRRCSDGRLQNHMHNHDRSRHKDWGLGRLCGLGIQHAIHFKTSIPEWKNVRSDLTSRTQFSSLKITCNRPSSQSLNNLKLLCLLSSDSILWSWLKVYNVNRSSLHGLDLCTLEEWLAAQCRGGAIISCPPSKVIELLSAIA